MDLNNIQEEDVVYFDVLGWMLVHYPVRLVRPLTIIVIVLFVMVLTSGIKKRHLTFRGYILGFVAPPFNLFCLALTSSLVGLLIPAGQGPTLTTFNVANFHGVLMLLGFVALTLIICSGTYVWFSKRAGAKDLALGGLSWWSIMMIVVAFHWPGSSHLFVWPLLFSLLPYGIVLASSKMRFDSVEPFVMFSLCAIPGIILIVPAIYSLYMGLGLNLPAAPMILLVYLISLIIPHFNLRRSYTPQSARERDTFKHLL
jgi:hypothetical protein